MSNHSIPTLPPLRDPPRVKLTLVLNMSVVVAYMTAFIKKARDRAYEPHSSECIDWCIQRSLQETLMLQIHGHASDSFVAVLYEDVRELIDQYVFEYHRFCLPQMVSDLSNPVYYFRKGNDVFLVCAED